MSKVREALRLQVMSWIPGSVVGTVTAVQAPDTCTVEPIDGGAEYFKVRLRGVIDGADDGMYAEPKINSYVIISPLMNDEGMMFVSRFTEVTKWHIKVDGGAKVEVLSGGNVKLNGDTHNGLVKVAELVQKLNALENDLNTIKGVFSGWTPVAQDGGAALKAASAAWAGQTLTTTAQVDLENQKVKHGS